MILKVRHTHIKKLIKLLINLSLLTGFVAAPIQTTFAKDRAQGNVPLAKAKALLSDLTPQEKVGQLFLVTFKGTDTSEKSQIFSLVSQHYVGGVVLERKNDNFTGNDTTIRSAYDLISNLQDIDWQASQPGAVSGELSTLTPSYVPLFIGISQEGDGAPYSQIVNGLLQIPNEMTSGGNLGSVFG